MSDTLFQSFFRLGWRCRTALPVPWWGAWPFAARFEWCGVESGIGADVTIGIASDEGLQVTLPSGETVAATLKGRDGSTDLAVLACETGGSATATFAEGAVRVGQIALTVGRTRDRGPIATMGL